MVAENALPKGIRLRGSSYQVDVTYKGKRRTATCATLEDALRVRSELLLAMQRGLLDLPEVATDARPSWTLGQAYDHTLASRWTGTRGEHTAKMNAFSALTFFGRDIKLEHIDTEALDGWVASLINAGNSNGTVNRKLAALSCLMTVAHERNRLPGGKPKFPRRKESKGRIRFVTEGEETALLKLLTQWGKMGEADAVTVLIDTGLRTGELYRIEMRDCDFRTRMLSVWETKADLPRSIPMTTRVLEILHRRSQTYWGKLFPYHDQWLRHSWDRAKVAMGLSDDLQFVPHALRHTFASRLVQRNVNLRTVQQLMGHKTLDMTMRYSHLAPANLQAAVALLEPAQVAT